MRAIREVDDIERDHTAAPGAFLRSPHIEQLQNVLSARCAFDGTPRHPVPLSRSARAGL
jgi:hypothetical protein